MIPFIQVLEQATLIYGDKKSEWWLPLTLGEIEKGHREILWVIKTFCVLRVVWVSQVYTFVKTHPIVHLKSMHFIFCELNLNIDINIHVELLHGLSACVGV